MKKLLMIVLFVLLASPVAVFAIPVNSGEYMFTEPGNDPSNPSADLTALEQLIENWFLNAKQMTIDCDLEFYAKADAPSTTTTEGSGDLAVGYSPDKKAGTWDTGIPIDFYSVKAGPQYALYWVDPSADSGTWSTKDLFVGSGNNPEISHLSTWICNGNGHNVPEPATLLLLGTGLVGFAGFRKKFRKA